MPIPVAGYEDREDKRIYVWFDAVIGYLSASIEWAENRGTPDAWREWWQNPSAEHTYFMGKDNIVFHTVIWPSMLLGYGSGGDVRRRARRPQASRQRRLERVPDDGREEVQLESRRADPRARLPDRYDPDALRYFLTIAGPETQDTDFTWAEFVRRNNDELVATWGNLVNRTLQSAYKNFGAVPTPATLTADDEALLREVESGFDSVGALIEAARFRTALQEAMRLAALGNQYIAEQAPWTKLETGPRARRRRSSTSHCASSTVSKVLLAPFIPFSAQRLHATLGYDGVIAGPLEFRRCRKKTPSTSC